MSSSVLPDKRAEYLRVKVVAAPKECPGCALYDDPRSDGRRPHESSANRPRAREHRRIDDRVRWGAQRRHRQQRGAKRIHAAKRARADRDRAALGRSFRGAAERLPRRSQQPRTAHPLVLRRDRPPPVPPRVRLLGNEQHSPDLRRLREGIRRHEHGPGRARDRRRRGGSGAAQPGPRSEEHTSELQSRELISYAVFCLKKKKKIGTIQLSTSFTTIKKS